MLDFDFLMNKHKHLSIVCCSVQLCMFQIVSQMQSSSKKGMPQGMYTLYFDYLESSAHMPDKVDLRANTSIFVH